MSRPPALPSTPSTKAQALARASVARESKRKLAALKQRAEGGDERARAQLDKPKRTKPLSAREKALAKAAAVDEVRKAKAAKAAVKDLPLRIDLANPDPEVLAGDDEGEDGSSLVSEKGVMGAKPGQRMEKAERRVLALNMRIVGHDYRVIAQELGVSLKVAYMDVQEALVYLSKHERLLAERVRELELSRLDAMQTMIWPAIERADPFAVQAYLKIMDHRARMLGLYTPEKLDIVAEQRPLRSLTDEELMQRTDQLLATIRRKALPPALSIVTQGDGAVPLPPGEGMITGNVTVESRTDGWSDTEPITTVVEPE